MFVGHGLLALAVVSAVAVWLGRDRHDALALGLVAAGFATLPDVDVLYPLVAVLGRTGPVAGAADSFWALSTTVHRGATHSLVVGLWTTAGVALWATHRGRPIRNASPDETLDGDLDPAPDTAQATLSGRVRADHGTRIAGAVVLGAMVATVGAVGGPLAGATVAVMALGAVALATAARRWGVSRRGLLGAALFGLLSHPFGDLLTGQPPPLLFPVDASLLSTRITVHGDPTLHLVGAFLFELAAIWLAVVVVARLAGRRPWSHVRPQALAGVGFAVAVLVIPPPSLSAATGFVGGALAVGVLGVPLRRRPSRVHCWNGLCTGLAAVTLAVVSYGVVYALW